MESKAKGGRSNVSWLLILPLVLILVPFFIVPIIGVIAASFVQSDGFGGIIPSFTLDNYKSVLTSQLTLQLYWATLKFAVFAWFFSLLIGFWIAYFLVFHVRNQLLALGLFLLGKEGLINSALGAAGVIDQPLDILLFSSLAVVIAYVHQLTIFMIVPIFNSMARIDKRTIEAARDAGASRFDIVRLIVLPLCKTGIALGSIFVV